MNRILSGVVEIATAALTVTSQPPVFTGENGALEVSVSFVMNGAVEDITGYTAEMYLFWAERKEMTEAVQMTVINDTATGSFGEGLTAQAGSPLLVIQLTDSGTGALIVACAQPVQISATRGEVVLTTRPPTPSEIVYVGRAPYINTLNNNWMIWDNDSGSYVDSGVGAVGTPNVGSVQGKTGSVVLYGTDIALSTSDSTKLTTAIANAGQVETVAGVGVATGTKNVPLKGSDLPVSASDNTTIDAALAEKVSADVLDIQITASNPAMWSDGSSTWPGGIAPLGQSGTCYLATVTSGTGVASCVDGDDFKSSEYSQAQCPAPLWVYIGNATVYVATTQPPTESITIRGLVLHNV